MKKLLASLVALFILTAPLSAFAMENSWEITLRNSDDTADVGYNIDRPGLDLGPHVMMFDGTAYPQWYNMDRFRDEILVPYEGMLTTSALYTALGTATSSINETNDTQAGQISSLFALVAATFKPNKFFGKSASTTPYVASSTPGLMSAEMVTKLAALSTSTPQHVERVRAQTNGSGSYTMTFNQSFSATPVVSIDVESSVSGITQAYITSISTTAVTIQTTRAINVLGLLTLQSSPQLYVHIMAMEP